MHYHLYMAQQVVLHRWNVHRLVDNHYMWFSIVDNNGQWLRHWQYQGSWYILWKDCSRKHWPPCYAIQQWRNSAQQYMCRRGCLAQKYALTGTPLLPLLGSHHPGVPTKDIFWLLAVPWRMNLIKHLCLPCRQYAWCLAKHCCCC